MDQIKKLQIEFDARQNLSVVFGDEVRQKLLLLILAGDRNGGFLNWSDRCSFRVADYEISHNKRFRKSDAWARWSMGSF